MSELVPIQFAKQTNQPFSRVVSSELCENLYLEKNLDGSKSPISLLPTPGISTLVTLGNGPIRGMAQAGSDLYVVSGNTLYKVTQGLTTTELATVAQSGPVTMLVGEPTAALLGIRTSSEFYAWNGTTLTTNPEGGFSSAAFQDGYGILTRTGTEQFFLTGLDDFSTMSGLDFSSTDAFADLLVGCISDHRRLWLFGEKTIEVWENAGISPFPFVRSGSGFMERGCASANSIAKAQNHVFWLGDDLIVYTASGYQPQRISTHGVEELIRGVVSPETAEGFTYALGGHTFYVLTFTEATLVLDIGTGLWHSRKSFGLNRWRVGNFVLWNQRPVVGDYSNGKVYLLTPAVFSEAGDPLIRRAVAPPLYFGGKQFITDELFIDIEAGQGLVTGQGSDPQLMLDFSDDGGRTWSNELWRSAGEIGEYGIRARWHGLGSSRERMYRVTQSDPTKLVITGAFARVEVLSE